MTTRISKELGTVNTFYTKSGLHPLRALANGDIDQIFCYVMPVHMIKESIRWMQYALDDSKDPDDLICTYSTGDLILRNGIWAKP